MSSWTNTHQQSLKNWSAKILCVSFRKRSLFKKQSLEKKFGNNRQSVEIHLKPALLPNSTRIHPQRNRPGRRATSDSILFCFKFKPIIIILSFSHSSRLCSCACSCWTMVSVVYCSVTTVVVVVVPFSARTSWVSWTSSCLTPPLF